MLAIYNQSALKWQGYRQGTDDLKQNTVNIIITGHDQNMICPACICCYVST